MRIKKHYDMLKKTCRVYCNSPAHYAQRMLFILQSMAWAFVSMMTSNYSIQCWTTSNQTNRIALDMIIHFQERHFSRFVLTFKNTSHRGLLIYEFLLYRGNRGVENSNMYCFQNTSDHIPQVTGYHHLSKWHCWKLSSVVQSSNFLLHGVPSCRRTLIWLNRYLKIEMIWRPWT